MSDDSELLNAMAAAARYLDGLTSERAPFAGDTWAIHTLLRRSEAHDAGLSDSAEARALDLAVIKTASMLVALVGAFEYPEGDERRQTIGLRPHPPEHWWWYLDEMLAGTRPWPEGLKHE